MTSEAAGLGMTGGDDRHVGTVAGGHAFHNFVAPSLRTEARLPRDVLPLPRPGVRHSNFAAAFSRGCQQRVGRKRAAAVDLDHAVRSLNWLESHAAQSPLGASDGAAVLSTGQHKVMSHVKQAVAELGPPPADLTPAEALRKLRLSSWYEVDCDSTAKASFDMSRLSLPEGLAHPVPLSELWGAGGEDCVNRFCAREILPQSVAAERIASCGVVRPFADPALRTRRHYEELVAHNFSVGSSISVSTMVCGLTCFSCPRRMGACGW